MRIKTIILLLSEISLFLLAPRQTVAQSTNENSMVKKELIQNKGLNEEHCRIDMDVKPSDVIFEDTTATLICTIKYIDELYKNETIIWYKDHEPLVFDYLEESPGVALLQIEGAKLEQNGIYYCKPNISATCNGNRNSIQLKVLIELSKSCNETSECAARPRSFCDEGICRCRPGYNQNKNTCYTSGGAKSQEIYKAAMVALACFMVTIIGLFVLFLCNKSFLRRGSSSIPLDDMDSRRSSDIFNVAEGLAAMRHVDKPPTYQQVVAQEMRVRGCPPPLYTEVAPTFDTTMVHRSRMRDQGQRSMPRTVWSRLQNANSEPAILNITSSQLLQRHADRGHINLARSISNSSRSTALSGSVNSAFVSDA